MNNIVPSVEQISEGIAILILMIIGTSLEKLVEVENWLESTPARVRRALFLYLVGIIVYPTKANPRSITKKVGYVSHDTLTRALLKGERVLRLLPLLLIKWCLSQTGGYLIIDDVIVPKPYSRKIEGVYNEFDHTEKRRIKGMRIIMLLWSNGSLRIPVAWAIWHKEKKYLIGRTARGTAKYRHTGQCELDGRPLPYKTKNQLAMELLEEVLARGLKPKYAVFDNWYASRNNLIMITQNHFSLTLPCYSRLKSNRKVVYQGVEMTLSQLARRFHISSFNHKHGAYIKALTVFLPDFGDIRLLLVRNDSHRERGKTKYLFSTSLFDSASRILLSYRSRWAIETTFRDLKNHLNLESCQARALKAQQSHLALVILAFVLLQLLPTLKFQRSRYSSIADKKFLLSHLSLFSLDSKSRFWVLNPFLPGATFIPLENLDLGIVNFCIDFAYQTLLFPSCQRTA